MLSHNLEKIMSEFDVIADHSYKNYTSVPKTILQMGNLKMLYLNGNSLDVLPHDFFQKLTKLYWLDLRDNKLVNIPAGIAHHQHLENLLLSNNQIARLPNELGLVANLKVLHLSGNNLTYPESSIINRGVAPMLAFLKKEYERENVRKVPEKEDDSLCDSFDNCESSAVSTSAIVPKNAYNLESVPTVLVKQLSENIKSRRASYIDEKCEKMSKTHTVTKTLSKLSVHSQYNSERYLTVLKHKEKKHDQRIAEQTLKEMWLDQLKDLIRDQQKIIQQEKSLEALSSWRKAKKKEMPRPPINDINVDAPFDTNPDYYMLMSRSDTSRDVEELIRQKQRSGKPLDGNIDALISDVLKQLREVEETLQTDSTPEEKISNAEKEIRTIIDLHRKISSLKNINEVTLT